MVVSPPNLLRLAEQGVRRGISEASFAHQILSHHKILRVPAALLFFHFGLRGELPTLFWALAGVGDLLAGTFAATALLGPRALARYRAIHLFGLADFVIAVGTGLAFTLAQDPRMILLTGLPMALIPLSGVGISGATHGYALAMLRNARAG